MRQIITIVILLLCASLYAQPDRLSGKSVLIYTRTGEGYVHENIPASVEALEELCGGMGVKAEHTDDPAIFESRRLKKFDAIIFSNSNDEAFLNELQRENFKAYIRSGKGFMAIHAAIQTERQSDWFGQMTGGKFVRHPEIQPFDIKVIDGEHPSTTHLPEVWKWDDDCYYSNHLNPAIHVLLAADLTTLDDPEKEEYPGDVFGDLFPLAWCHVFENSRVFYTALGHKIEHYKDENFRMHLRGGIVWIMGE